MHKRIRTQLELEDSAIFRTLGFRLVSEFPGYRLFIDEQNLIAISIQLETLKESVQDGRITSIRSIPVGLVLFDSGLAYMSWIILDFIFGDRACTDESLKNRFAEIVSNLGVTGKEIETEDGKFFLKFYGADIEKMGFQCDTENAREWEVPLDTASTL